MNPKKIITKMLLLSSILLNGSLGLVQGQDQVDYVYVEGDGGVLKLKYSLFSNENPRCQGCYLNEFFSDPLNCDNNSSFNPLKIDISQKSLETLVYWLRYGQYKLGRDPSKAFNILNELKNAEISTENTGHGIDGRPQKLNLKSLEKYIANYLKKIPSDFEEEMQSLYPQLKKLELSSPGQYAMVILMNAITSHQGDEFNQEIKNLVKRHKGSLGDLANFEEKINLSKELGIFSDEQIKSRSSFIEFILNNAPNSSSKIGEEYFNLFADLLKKKESLPAYISKLPSPVALSLVKNKADATETWLKAGLGLKESDQDYLEKSLGLGKKSDEEFQQLTKLLSVNELGRQWAQKWGQMRTIPGVFREEQVRTSKNGKLYKDISGRVGLEKLEGPIWLDQETGLAWLPKLSGNFTQGGAIKFCDDLNENVANGIEVRLPSINDFTRSITQTGTYHKNEFMGGDSGWFWSSTTTSTGRGKFFSADEGGVYDSDVGNFKYFRCVIGPFAW